MPRFTDEKPSRLTEAKAKTAALPKGDAKQAFRWCAEVRGFGVRTTANGTRSYVLQTRQGGNGKSVRKTLGLVEVMPWKGTADEPGALDLALRALNGARHGTDMATTLGKAAAHTFTLGQAWEAWKDAGFPAQGRGAQDGKFKRASSIKIGNYNWKNHVSKLGKLPVASITDPVIERWRDKIKGNTARKSALLILRGTVSFARSRGLCATPQITVKAGRSRKVQNYLTPAELKAFEVACIALAKLTPRKAIGYQAARVVMRTGSRKSEMLKLRRDLTDLDNKVARFPITKGSDEGRDVHLSDEVVAILRSLPVIQGNPYFFPGKWRGEHLQDIFVHVKAALKHARLKDVRVHDLRHSFASAAVSKAKIGIPALQKLLGHNNIETTMRYAHLAADAERAAAKDVANVLSF